MPWILDGNNLARGGDREAVRRAALAVGRREKVRILVFFDGRPPDGAGDVERLGAVEIRYVGHADGAIVAFLREGGRGWRVATDDRELQRRSVATGAEAVPAAAFWQKAEATSARSPGGREDATAGVAQELAYLRDDRRRLPEEPSRIPRRRRPRSR
jgi:hypothetical protein